MFIFVFSNYFQYCTVCQDCFNENKVNIPAAIFHYDPLTYDFNLQNRLQQFENVYFTLEVKVRSRFDCVFMKM